MFSRGRVPFATRTLLHDPLRLVISVGGIGFAILLILLLRGILDGTVAKSTTYIDHVGADVVVARAGVTNMTLAASVLPRDDVARLQAADGVALASGILRLPVIVSSDETKRPAALIAYDPAAGLGGPWKLHSGRSVLNAGESVVDRVLADELGIGLGSEISVGGQAFTVVGLSSETTAIAGKNVFISLADESSLTGVSDIVSFVLLRLQPGTDPDTFANEVNASMPDVTATSRARLSQNDRDLVSQLFVAPINVMATVGFLVGLAIIGLTMYTTTNERLHDFGVLKAIGAPPAFMFRTVLVQAMILGSLGFVVGLGAALGMAPLIVRLVPDIGISVHWVPALETLAAVLAMSLVGSVLPVVRVVSVDPLIVFRR